VHPAPRSAEVVLGDVVMVAPAAQLQTALARMIEASPAMGSINVDHHYILFFILDVMMLCCKIVTQNSV